MIAAAVVLGGARSTGAGADPAGARHGDGGRACVPVTGSWCPVRASWWWATTPADSYDSRQFGYVRAKDLLGVVVRPGHRFGRWTGGNPTGSGSWRREMTMPGEEAMPSTVRRSPKKAQRTWVKAHDSAVETYGEGRRAHQTAFAALKHSFEKVGDHWEPKEERGPSDEQAERGAGDRRGDTAGGVDAASSKQHLYDLAKRLDIAGRSSMTKQQLVNALQRANERKTAEARSK